MRSTSVTLRRCANKLNEFYVHDRSREPMTDGAIRERPTPSGRRRDAHPILVRLALIVTSLFVSILLLEGILRVAVPHWGGIVPQRFMTVTEDGVLAGVPNFDGRIASLYGDFDVPFRLDARGFRNPPDADPAAPLAFVGDSFCQGLGIEREDSYPFRTAALLNTPFYNFCTVSADLLDDLRIVNRWMPPRRRVTVLTITFENDVLAYPDSAIDGGPSAAVQGLSRGAIARWLMNHSAFFDVATTLARQNATIVAGVRRLGLVGGVPVSTGDPAESIAASIRMVERIKKACGVGPFLVLTVPPRPGQVEFVSYDEFVSQLVRTGFDVVDPNAQPGLEISTIPNDGHWDAAMNAAIAPILAERLRAVADW